MCAIFLAGDNSTSPNNSKCSMASFHSMCTPTPRSQLNEISVIISFNGSVPDVSMSNENASDAFNLLKYCIISNASDRCTGLAFIFLGCGLVIRLCAILRSSRKSDRYLFSYCFSS